MGEGVCQVHEMTMKHFEQFQENQKDMVKGIAEVRDRIIIAEQSSKSAHRRLDSQEEQTKAIIKMSTSIEYMAKQVESMLELLKEHDGRLDKLEKAPGDHVLGYWKLFIGALITGSAGIFIGLIMNGGL
ncbi:MAG: hypothetical protein JXR88_12595 [Clostridia bacterium]|nr:hypothetical protein [Clostridia bacterium]